MDAVLEQLDVVAAPNFHMWGDWESVGSDSPPARQLRTHVEEWLASLDAHEVRDSWRKGGLAAAPSIVLEPGPGRRLRLRPIPVREGAARTPGPRSIGVEGPAEMVWIDKARPLKECLKGKKRKYGALTHPYLLAVLDLEEYPPHHDDHERTLYGSARDS